MMIKYKLIINPFAEQDLKDTKNWYDLQKEKLSIEFIEEVDILFKRIINNPFQFPVTKKNKIRKALVKRFPFSVLFYIEEDIINVFAVFHTYRNPNTWKKRIK